MEKEDINNYILGVIPKVESQEEGRVYVDRKEIEKFFLKDLLLKYSKLKNTTMGKTCQLARGAIQSIKGMEAVKHKIMRQLKEWKRRKNSKYDKISDIVELCSWSFLFFLVAGEGIRVCSIITVENFFFVFPVSLDDTYNALEILGAYYFRSYVAYFCTNF